MRANIPGIVGDSRRGRNVEVKNGWLLLLQGGIHGALWGLGGGGWR